MITLRNLCISALVVLTVSTFPAMAFAQSKTAPSLAPFLARPASAARAPDGNGFMQRWLILDPIPVSGQTESVVRAAVKTEYFPNQFTVISHDGDKVTVADQELAWHALDSANWNVKLFRFAYGLNKQSYGVLFWAVTVVKSTREMQNVRMGVGSNSASIWWLNAKEAVILSGDRRMVMDDCISKRLTLNKGRNVIRGAVINGPGLSDFCIRFVDESGKPIKDLTLSLDNAGR